jgi:hypothetical protein
MTISVSGLFCVMYECHDVMLVPNHSCLPGPHLPSRTGERSETGTLTYTGTTVYVACTTVHRTMREPLSNHPPGRTYHT